MVQVLTILETILLGFTGIVACISLTRVLSTARSEEQYSAVTILVFMIMIIASIIGLRLIWL